MRLCLSLATSKQKYIDLIIGAFPLLDVYHLSTRKNQLHRKSTIIKFDKFHAVYVAYVLKRQII